MSETNTPGANLRAIRRERGYTQEGLAGVAGVSKEVIAKLEQGRRSSASMASFMKLADALDVGLSELTGKRDRIGPDRDGGRVLALRNVLISPMNLPGVEAPEDDSEPLPLAELLAEVGAAAGDYWKGDFGALLVRLPGLIVQAHRTRADVGAAAAKPLALSYDLGASLLVHLGHDALAALAAERAIDVAHKGNDELLWATLNGTFSWILLHQGRLEEAEELAVTMANRIEPTFRGDPDRVAAWGNLLMTALAPAAAAKRDVSEYISLAASGAERLGRRVGVYQTSFGPASVQMQATHAYTTLGEAGRALEAARRIRPGDLTGISYGRHLLDVAQAHMIARHRNAAVERLQEARGVSEMWFRHQAIAESLVRDIREEQTRPSRAIQSLARAFNI